MGQKCAATIGDAGTSKRDQLEFANALEKRLERLVEHARAKRRSRLSSQTSARSEPEPEPDAVLETEEGAELEGDENTQQRQRPPEAESSTAAPPPAIRERFAPANVPRATARERLLQSQMHSIAGAGRAAEAGAGVAPDLSSERDSESALSVYSVSSDLEAYSVAGEPVWLGAHPSSSGGPGGSLARKSSLRIDLLRAQRERDRTRGALPGGGANKGPLSASYYSLYCILYANMVLFTSVHTSS